MLLLRDRPDDRRRAGEMLKVALDLSRSIGMPWYAERADKLMNAHSLGA